MKRMNQHSTPSRTTELLKTIDRRKLEDIISFDSRLEKCV